VRQPYVDRLVREFAADCTVVRLGSAELVQMAEDKLRGITPDSDQMAAIMARLFAQPGGERIDQLVLACTHFPLLADEIAAASPACVTLVDSGAGIARRAAFLMANDAWPETATGRAVFTRDGNDVSALAPALARYGLTAIDTL
jgi:glutamate racemase